jgi:hypothetical protein
LHCSQLVQPHLFHRSVGNSTSMKNGTEIFCLL